MKVYVACTRRNVEAAREIMEILEENDIENAVDWTVDVDDWPDLTRDELIHRNVAARQHIMTSDAVVIRLVPEAELEGCRFIAGMAMGFGIPVIILNEEATRDFDHFFTKSNQLVAEVATTESMLAVLHRIDTGPAAGIKLDPENTLTPRQQMQDLLMKIHFVHHELGGIAMDLVQRTETFKNELPFFIAGGPKIRRRSVQTALDSMIDSARKLKVWFKQTVEMKPAP